MSEDQRDVLSGPLHFVGIGGYGMSALALVMWSLGVQVSGCDVSDSARVERLRAEGIPVELDHSRDHISGARAVVYSTDVPDTNPEILAAKEEGLPLLHRSCILAYLFDMYPESIAVSGTHGKTTTTAMMAAVLEAAGRDPTVLVGGELASSGFTARVGGRRCLVAEACESDGSFLRYHPRYIIATNLEPEHLEFYDDSFDHLRDAFAGFLSNVRTDGTVVINADDGDLCVMGREVPGRVVSCSTVGNSFDYVAHDVQLGPDSSRFSLRRGEEIVVERLSVTVPGQHMVSNALQVAALALEMGCSISAVREGLASYRGVGRRFQRIGEVNGAMVVDDYAHHPTEIAATLGAAKGLTRGRVLAVFQPQRYTRTQSLMEEFSRCFDDADELVLTPIYSPPGQQAIDGVSSEALADKIQARVPLSVQVMEDQQEIVDHLLASARPGDVVLTMGAGNVWKVAELLTQR